MPSWANHFRIADKLLPQIQNINADYFIIGNIAPDCGIPDSKHGVYNPPTGATHFTKDYLYSKKTDCNYNYIYNTYIKNESNRNKKSFFIGYYVHLFTDCYYANRLFMPIEKKFGDFRNNEKLRKTVAAQRNNIDFSYFKNNVSDAFERFKSYDGFNEDYPDWYRNNEISRQMKNIVDFYAKNEPIAMEYTYITPEMMNDFVRKAAQKVLNDIQNKDIVL